MQPPRTRSFVRTARTTALFAASLLCLLASRAGAQPYDHLQCFKIKDPGAFKTATLDLSDTLFGGASGCVIKRKARELCIPVQKSVTSIDDGTDTPLPGQDQAFDRLCYKVKCPTAELADQVLRDQFGSRGFERFKTALVCTPAVKGPAPVCGNAVVEAGEQCDPPLSAGGAPDCADDCLVAVCGDGVREASEGCESDTDCAPGDVCTAGCTCLDGGCPGRVDLLLHAGTGLFTTATEIDSGWTGIEHDADLADGARLSLAVCSVAGSGPASCGEADLCGIDADASSCRCSHDNHVACGEPFGPDAASCSVGVSCLVDDDCRVCSATTSTSCGVDSDCPAGEHCLTGLRRPTCSSGQCVGTCECFLAPPEPFSRGNTPGCTLRKLGGDVTGTWNVDTGDAELALDVRARVYTGDSLVDPCPSCVGDVAANDGLRDGTCSGGDNAGEPCDANTLDASFPAPGGGSYSHDCRPDGGKNISGTGIELAYAFTTGSYSLPAVNECGFPPFEPQLCPCGVCANDAFSACASNDDCAICTTNADCAGGECDGAGRCSCGLSGLGETQPNGCADGVCSPTGADEGVCLAGPTDRFCDAIVRADGSGFIACLSNADCAVGTIGIAAGDCALSELRECFLDPLAATGVTDAASPVLASAHCRGRLSRAGFNTVFGYPGPERIRRAASASYPCAATPAATYPGCP